MNGFIHLINTHIFRLLERHPRRYSKKDVEVNPILRLSPQPISSNLQMTRNGYPQHAQCRIFTFCRQKTRPFTVIGSLICELNFISQRHTIHNRNGMSTGMFATKI